MKPWLFSFSLLCAVLANAQEIEQDLRLNILPTGEKTLEWQGYEGRSYFFQSSPDLKNWTWAPNIEAGVDASMSYEVESNTDKGFFRLEYTDQTATDLDNADFDGDGLTNLEEITLRDNPASGGIVPLPLGSLLQIQTDPLNPDTDGDGLNDGWEQTHGRDPRNADENGNGIPDGTDDDDGDGADNSEEVGKGTDPNNAANFPLQAILLNDLYVGYNGNMSNITDKTSWYTYVTWDRLSAETPERVYSSELVTDSMLSAFLVSKALPNDPPSSLKPYIVNLDTMAIFNSCVVQSSQESNILYNLISRARAWLRSPAAEYDRSYPVARYARYVKFNNDSFEGAIASSGLEELKIVKGKEFSNSVDLKYYNSGEQDSETDSYEAVIPLKLEQSNMPNVGLAQNTTDLSEQYKPVNIDSKGVAYITGQPTMPQLKASFPGLPAAVKVDWKLEIKSERPERGIFDDKEYQKIQVPGDEPWDITATIGSDFIGGKCKLYCKIGTVEKTFEFYIRGKNPKDEVAKTYITSNSGSQTYPYAWAMIQHESRQEPRCYNQFNSGGDGQSYLEAPNFTGKDGWGISQLDNPLGVKTSTNETYHWKQNVDKFFLELKEKEDAADRFFNAVAQAYPNNPDAASPPSAYKVNGTNTEYSAKDLAIMILYNGTEATQTSKLNGVTYTNPWKFNPSGNPKWTFQDNVNGYAFDVIRHEVEHGYTIEE